MVAFLKKLLHLSEENLPAFGKTHVGQVRDHNEDDFRILEERKLYLVADGMGGHNAGEVASKMTINSLARFFPMTKVEELRGNSVEIRHSLITAFHDANDRVIERAGINEAQRGMGCTLVACLVNRQTLHTCHVGDARCYLFDGKTLVQITKDHSAIVSKGEEGVDSDADESPEPGRHVINRAIGFPFPEDPEYHCREVEPGNRLLLCTDGLWSMVDDGEMKKIIRAATTPKQACEKLIAKANEAGGKDNITAVVVFIPD